MAPIPMPRLTGPIVFSRAIPPGFDPVGCAPIGVLAPKIRCTTTPFGHLPLVMTGRRRPTPPCAICGWRRFPYAVFAGSGGAFARGAGDRALAAGALKAGQGSNASHAEAVSTQAPVASSTVEAATRLATPYMLAKT